jgi:hypothetical protein
VLRWVVVLAALAVVGPASAATPTSKTFSIPLPAPRTGTIVEFVATGVPGQPAVQGDPFSFRIANLASLPSYIRAAADVIRVKPLEFDIFVAVNAPKGLVPRRLAGNADALDLIVFSAASAFPSGKVLPISGHGCLKFAYDHKPGKYVERYVTLGPWKSDGASIFTFTKAADKHCS